MSKIEVDAIEPQSGTALTIGASGDTITIPSGATLTNAGTATGFAAIAWQSVVTAATLTAVAGRGYPINTSSNACTVTLPAAASVGDQIIFTDYARNWGTNALTINPNSLKYQGNTSPNPVYDTNGESLHIVYMDATKGWVPLYDGAVALETPQTFSLEMLVVAGGGGSGEDQGGGGGGGGYRTSTQTVTANSTVLTVTVGDGGATKTAGSDSSISGSGLTTITSTGGGRGGGTGQATGGDGGSGGGGSGNGELSNPNPVAGGSGNTPSTSPSQGEDGGDGNGSPGNRTGGGGGGAGAAGSNGNTAGTAGGNGGDGTSNSITGSGVYYAGGGGGAKQNAGSFGTGGQGGGGAGTQTTGTAGGTNLGGGAGGTTGTGSGAAGGKGVIILKIPDASYSGITSGSPTVDTSSVTDYTILKYTGTGSYTT